MITREPTLLSDDVLDVGMLLQGHERLGLVIALLTLKRFRRMGFVGVG